MLAELDALLTALYVVVDDFLPARGGPGRRPVITDAELIALAIAQIFWTARPGGASCGSRASGWDTCSAALGDHEAVKRELAARRWRYTQNYADAKTDVVEEILTHVKPPRGTVRPHDDHVGARTAAW